MLEAFDFPDQGAAEAFAAAQPVLYRRAPELQTYFYAIQKHVRFDPPGEGEPAGRPSRLRRALMQLMHGAQQVAMHVPRRDYRADVLLCGTWLWERPQENELLARLLRGLLRRDVAVLCLIHTGTDLYRRLVRIAGAHSGPGRVTFLDPRGLIGRLDERLKLNVACARAWTDFQRVRAMLRAHGLYLSGRAWPDFAWTAAQELAWKRWAPHVRFETAIVRCHWLPLCSAVAQSGLQRNKKVATLQQGVVSHSLDLPIMAHQFFCFGEASERVLRDMDRAFAQATGRKVTCTDYVRAGSLIDPVLPLEDNFDRRAALIMDQSTRWATGFYGLEAQNAALEQLVAVLCKKCAPLRKVIIRPHPLGYTLPAWKRIAAAHPGRCEISLPEKQSLADDLRRSSVAVGLFSGALTAAAASGLPTYFLRTPGGYFTPDLACFQKTQFLEAGPLFREIRRLCSERAYYRDAQARCQRAAATYHEGLAQPSGEALADELLRRPDVDVTASSLSNATHVRG